MHTIKIVGLAHSCVGDVACPDDFPFVCATGRLCGCATLGWSPVSVGSGEKLTFSLTHTNSRVQCARVCVRFSSCFFRSCDLCHVFTVCSSSSFHLTGTHKERDTSSSHWRTLSGGALTLGPTVEPVPAGRSGLDRSRLATGESG